MAQKQGQGRGRLSSIDLLPREVDDIVSWAADELSSRDRTQVDIYDEFVARLNERKAEFGGDLDFEVPGIRSFNRHALRLAKLGRMLDQTREIVTVLAGKFDPKKSDEMTVVAAETIKSLVLHMIQASAGELDIKASKNVSELANAFRAATQAQSVSSERRRKAEAEFEAKVNEAVATVAKAKGMSAETANAIKAEILGAADAK